MKISVTVKPRCKREKVELLPDGTYRVAVAVAAHEGQANEAAIQALALFFGIPKSRIQILSGAGGRRKIVEID